MSRVRRPFAAGGAHVPLAISGSGGALLLAFAVETAYFSGLSPDRLLTWGMLVAVLVSVPFAAALLYGGHWLERSSLDPDRYRRVGLWSLGGAGAFVALNLAIMAVWTPEDPWLVVGWIRGAVGLGGAYGLMIGITEARAIESALAAERSQMQVDQLDARREWLDYLNGLLRHEVLNNSQVISGYTSILLSDHDVDETVADRLRTIRRQSEDMARVSEDVRLLIESTGGENRLHAVDLVDVLAEEIEDLREAHGSAEIEADLPGSVHVAADEMLRRVFSNLLANAVEHNELGGAQIAVSVETADETATVRFEDNGPGVPPSVQESLFESSERRAGEHGLGLHLVSRLVERYDGSVELEETGPDGSVFAVELPRVEPGWRGPVEVPAEDAAAGGTAAPGDAGQPANTGAVGRGSPTE